MESKKLALLCRELADNKKAENTVILDVRNLSSITDYFVITSGATEPHLRAIVHEIADRLREEHALSPQAIDGDANTPWQVMDYFDVIVHVMRTDVRERVRPGRAVGRRGEGRAPGGKRAQARKEGQAQGRSPGKNGGEKEKEDGPPASRFHLTNTGGGPDHSSGRPGLLRLLLFLDGNFRRGRHHFIQDFGELVQAGRGDDDVVAAAIDVPR